MFQQNMPVLRHALSGNLRIYYTTNLLNVALECQASKNLSLKSFQDWKKFQKIQPGKTYAQALMSGKELNPGKQFQNQNAINLPHIKYLKPSILTGIATLSKICVGLQSKLIQSECQIMEAMWPGSPDNQILK